MIKKQWWVEPVTSFGNEILLEYVLTLLHSLFYFYFYFDGHFFIFYFLFRWQSCKSGLKSKNSSYLLTPKRKSTPTNSTFKTKVLKKKKQKIVSRYVRGWCSSSHLHRHVSNHHRRHHRSHSPPQHQRYLFFQSFYFGTDFHFNFPKYPSISTPCSVL